MYTDEHEYTTTFCTHFNRHIDLFNTNSINNLKIIVRKSKPTGSAAISQSFDNYLAQIDAVVGIHSAHAVANNHSAHAAVNNHSSMGVLLYNLVEFQSCRVCIYNSDKCQSSQVDNIEKHSLAKHRPYLRDISVCIDSSVDSLLPIQSDISFVDNLVVRQ